MNVRNGKDYSAQMARKAELGYSGAGYSKSFKLWSCDLVISFVSYNFDFMIVVEWDCDEKELKYSHVSKGLWKITTSKATPSVSYGDYSTSCSFETLNFNDVAFEF